MRLGNILKELLGENKDISIKWIRKPFILRPERKTLEPWKEVLSKKYSPEWTKRFEKQMKEAGKELQIEFNFDGNVGNSFQSLRLIHWISKNYPEKQEPLVKILSRNHFEKNLCVGEICNLIHGTEFFFFLSAIHFNHFILAVAEVGGVPLDDAEKFFSSGEFVEEVQQEIFETAQITFSIPLVMVYWSASPSEKITIQGAESESMLKRSLSKFLK